MSHPGLADDQALTDSEHELCSLEMLRYLDVLLPADAPDLYGLLMSRQPVTATITVRSDGRRLTAAVLGVDP